MHKTAQSLCFRLISSMYCELKSGDENREGQVTIHSLEMSLLLIAAVQVAFVFGMTAAPRTAIYIEVISEQHCARIWAALCAHQSNPSASLRGNKLLTDTNRCSVTGHRLMKLWIMALWNQSSLTSPALSWIRNPQLVIHRKSSWLLNSINLALAFSVVHVFSSFTQFNKPVW